MRIDPFRFHLLAASLCFAGSLSADTFTTVTPGNWSSAATWAGGNAPPTDLDGHDVVINHDVTVVNNDIKLIAATLIASNCSFTLQNGNFTVEGGTADFLGCYVATAHGFSIQITTSNASLSMVGCDVEVGQNFQLSEGVRYLEDVCLVVDENYQNAKGMDTLIDVCALIGADNSGNFQNDSDSSMHIEDSEFHLPNGDFQNASSATLTGNINAIWCENGNLQNDGSWSAQVAAYCISGQVTVSSSFLPSTQDCDSMPAIFAPCDCSGTGVDDCDSDGIPDDQETDCDSNGVPDDCEPSLDCDSNGIPDRCDLLNGAVDLDGNGVPDRCEPGTRIYCLGQDSDGGTMPCPCGNEVVPGATEGCANSTGVGASLTTTGSTSIAAADLALHVTQAPDGVPGYFFAGSAPVANGNGVPFYNGLRCVGGQIFRLGKVPSVIGGNATFPDPSGGIPIHAIVGAMPGDVSYLQFWYRDLGGPCGGAANMSNAVSVTWAP
jgi:hypothetical protein